MEYCNFKMTKYLGIPKNENEWLKYIGGCVIYCGKYRVSNVNQWDNDYIHAPIVMETEEETKSRLINGLASVGVKCEDVVFKWTDANNGTRCCACVCYYNKPYQVYNSEFFIKGLTEQEFESQNPNCQLEFSFYRRIEEYNLLDTFKGIENDIIVTRH